MRINIFSLIIIWIGLSFIFINPCQESNIIIEVSDAKGPTLKFENIPETALKSDNSTYYEAIYPMIYSQGLRF